LLFVAAPYHAFNFYNRGAMAEFLATAFIPIVMLGLRKIDEREHNGVLLAAFGYAALIGTHLPLALLGSVFLFAPYCAVVAYRNRGALVPMAAALAGGIALAAIYLIPALLLAPYRDTENLWRRAVLQPQNWTFWHPGQVDPSVLLGSLIIVGALAVPLVGLIIRRRAAWAVLGLVCGLLAIGTIPAIWTLPILNSVQFPFRLLPISEFALATALAMVPWKQMQLPAALVPVVISGFIITAPAQPPGISLEELAANHPDVPENLPPGDRPYSWPSRWALGIAATHRQLTVVNGVTTEPVFYFPAWQVSCGGNLVPIFPDAKAQLLSYRGAGCTRSLGMTAPERWGGIVSLVAFFLLIVRSLVSWRLRRLALRPKGGSEEVIQ
jgi:hypothetical protein